MNKKIKSPRASMLRPGTSGRKNSINNPKKRLFALRVQGSKSFIYSYIDLERYRGEYIYAEVCENQPGREEVN